MVVDHGFTEVGGRFNVSLGGLVRNTSEKIAYRTEVRLRITDGQGRDAVHPSQAAWLLQEIPVIRPGEVAAIGVTLNTRTDVSPDETPDRVTSFAVKLGSSTWLPVEDGAWFPAFPVTVERIERNGAASVDGGVRYSVASTACRQMIARGTGAVFLDKSGAVVGGLIDVAGGAIHCGKSGFTDKTVASDIPLGIDEAKTVVTEYCDVAKSQWGVYRPSGAPIN
ncbi:hypothetical protein L3i22_007650 [Actinoplanes sp. L3-i22]|nr:hypothetical protein L3i22_007650 [Actinoplanes sp. L3-i22]